MNIRAGDIRQVLINSREYDAAPEGTINLILTGFNNESQATGNGNVHTSQRRKLGGFDGLPLSIDDTRRDQESLQEVYNAGLPVPVTITMASGTVYSGSLVGEGELTANKGDGTLEVNMRGKTFEQI
jgi:hypothetical protein